MTPFAWAWSAFALFVLLSVITYRWRQYRRRMRRFSPPREWPMPFDYRTLEPPKKVTRPPRYVWPGDEK